MKYCRVAGNGVSSIFIVLPPRRRLRKALLSVFARKVTHTGTCTCSRYVTPPLGSFLLLSPIVYTLSVWAGRGGSGQLPQKALLHGELVARLLP